MKKALKHSLFQLPLIVFCIVKILEWQFVEKSIGILVGSGVLCIATATILLIRSKRLYRSEKLSMGTTILSLLTMQHAAGFSLIVVAVLAFNWLIDYFREIPPIEPSGGFLTARALFSFGLLFVVAVIVVLFEKQKLKDSIKPVHGNPPVTKGLVLTLSKWSKAEMLRMNSENIIASAREIRSRLPGMAPSTTIDFGKPKAYTDVSMLVRIIGESPLFPLFLAIEHHLERLEQVWLLTTEEAEVTTLTVFTKIVRAFYPHLTLKHEHVEDPDHVDQICDIVDHIYLHAGRTLRYPDHEITADITSGPASATAGIVLACVRSKRRVQYLSRRSNTLHAVDVTVHTIPHLIQELMDQMELINRNKDLNNE